MHAKVSCYFVACRKGIFCIEFPSSWERVAIGCLTGGIVQLDSDYKCGIALPEETRNDPADDDDALKRTVLHTGTL